ncbi:MAG: hypothetical protein AABZ55_15705 [Bdellovibrionota bacterium]
MKSIFKVYFGAIFLVSSFAQAATVQKLTCKGTKDTKHESAVVVISADFADIAKIDFESMSEAQMSKIKLPVKSMDLKITGIWKKSSRLGHGNNLWDADMLGKIYWDQHGGFPTATLAVHDAESSEISYRVYINTRDLGKSGKNVPLHVWTDPGMPEGGGHPSEFLCSSVVR